MPVTRNKVAGCTSVNEIVERRMGCGRSLGLIDDPGERGAFRKCHHHSDRLPPGQVSEELANGLLVQSGPVPFLAFAYQYIASGDRQIDVRFTLARKGFTGRCGPLEHRIKETEHDIP